MGNQASQMRAYSTFEEHRDCLRPDDSETPTLAHVAAKILDGEIDQIVVLAGAGISVSAGIPDFRSPGSGLYDNLGKYNLPSPEAIFDIDFFDQNPYPFFRLAGELFPGKFRPTPTHYFLTLLEHKQVLRRVFTQNIDTLESVAGLPEDRYVACHGNFSSNTCRRCREDYSQEWMKSKLFSRTTDTEDTEDTEDSDDRPNIPIPRCEECGGIVKPDITFFGESLPPRFEKLVVPDAQRCDLLLVMGTSLQVYPVGKLPDMVGPWVPRVLFNREPVHVANKFKLSDMLKEGDDDNEVAKVSRSSRSSTEDSGGSDDDAFDRDQLQQLKQNITLEEDEEVVDTGFWFELGQEVSETGTETRSCNYRDVFAGGNCDDTVREFVELLGWTEEFDLLIQQGNAKFDAAKKEMEIQRQTESEGTEAAVEEQETDDSLSNAMEKTNLN